MKLKEIFSPAEKRSKKGQEDQPSEAEKRNLKNKVGGSSRKKKDREENTKEEEEKKRRKRRT